MKSFDEMVADKLPQMEETLPIMSPVHACGILFEAFEKVWQCRTSEDDGSLMLEALVDMAIKTQVVAEWLYGIQRRTDSYKNQKEEIEKILLNLLQSMQHTKIAGPAQQIGKAPTWLFPFRDEMIKDIYEKLGV